MKLFEIGDGLKSIKVPDNYYSEQESDDIVLLFDPEKENIWIRISVITVGSKDSSDMDSAYKKICNDGKSEGFDVKIVDGKSYFTYDRESEENGEKIKLFFFTIGYRNNFIVISVTVPLEYAQNNNREMKAVLDDITQIIPTINDISPEGQVTLFEPECNDLREIGKRISDVLKISEQDIDACHNENKTIPLIQKLLDDNKFKADQTYELQSLGLAAGDYIQYKDNDYHWAIIRDEYGRDLCLEYKKTMTTVFPMTIISKRIEDGENVMVEKLINDILNKVKEFEESEAYEDQIDCDS